MSLNVWLTLPSGDTTKNRGSGIFVREGGRNKEITRQEWDERFPSREPYVVVYSEDDDPEVFSWNITHNLSKMAEEAGICDHLWSPEELGITAAYELIEPLSKGLRLLKSERYRFITFNPSNGWGDYDGLVEFVENYLEACIMYPNATIGVSR
jgi:hypothetical protein